MKNSKIQCDLKSCFLCTWSSADWLPAIAAQRKTFEVKKGEVIFSEGQPVTGIFFIYSGSAKVHKKWGSDKELIVRFARQGAILGHRGLGSESLYPVSATALEACSVCYIDLAFFQSTLKVNPELTLQLLTFFADELRESERRMRNLAHMSVKGRVAKALLILQEQFGKTTAGWIDILLSRQDLASFAGTTYETVFRVMNELMQENLIATDNKNIHIVDADGLKLLTELQDQATQTR